MMGNKNLIVFILMQIHSSRRGGFILVYHVLPSAMYLLSASVPISLLFIAISYKYQKPALSSLNRL